MGEEQLMSLEDICIRLKRFSFEEKMAICNQYSQLLMEPVGNVRIEHIRDITPWDLECFVMLAIKATPEYAENDFNGRNQKHFLNMINSINNADYTALVPLEGEEYLHCFVASIGLLQFDIQEDIRYKLFRYTYFFDYNSEAINMREIFFQKFGIYYERFMILGAFMNIIYGAKYKNVSRNSLNRLLTEIFPDVYEALSIDWFDYLLELDRITLNVNDYITCLRPSYKYPFIKRGNKAYYPLPHLMGRAVTSSLLYRLTEGDDKIREAFGKEVLESYVYDLVSESRCYERVEKERIYKREHNNIARTTDVMAWHDNHILFVEIKSSVPAMGLRIFDKTAYGKACKKHADSVKQLYKNMRTNYRKYEDYNPFKDKELVEDSNCWGIIVLLEDSYINRRDIYMSAAAMLNIPVESKDYEWLIRHIKVMSLYTIESYTLVGDNLIDVMKAEAEEGDHYNFTPAYGTRKKEINEKYLGFINVLIDRMKIITLKGEIK